MKRRRSGSLGMIAWWWALYSQICIFTHLSFLSLSSKTGEHEVNALWEGRHLVCIRGSLTYSFLHARILYLTVASGLLYFVFPESTWVQGSPKKRSWHNVFTHLTSVDLTSSHITSSHLKSIRFLHFLVRKINCIKSVVERWFWKSSWRMKVPIRTLSPEMSKSRKPGSPSDRNCPTQTFPKTELKQSQS